MAARSNEQTHTERDAKLDALHERLASAVDGLVSGEDWSRAIEFAARFRSRSFANTLLIYVQHAEAYDKGRVPAPFPSYVAGFRQWQQLDRQVAKGQSGYMINAPVTARFASASPTDVESWRRLDRAERPRPGEVVRSRMVGVRPAYVWDVSQTHGAPVPERPRPVLLEGQAPEGLWDGLAAQIEAAGFTLSTVPHASMIGGANGLTDYSTRVVAVRADMDGAAMVKTLAHELGHVLMHDPDADGRAAHRGIGEVEAESVAMMIGAAHGMNTDGYTIPYVSSWAAGVENHGPVEVVRRTGERVRTIAVRILDALENVPVEGGDPHGLTRPAPTVEKSASSRAAAPEPLGNGTTSPSSGRETAAVGGP